MSLDQEFKNAGKRKVVIEVDYNDVDALITRHIPNMNGRYECVAYEEWGNSQDHSMTIIDKIDIDDLEDVLESIKSGRWPNYRTSLFLNYLCSQGIIEPAEYLVSIFW